MMSWPFPTCERIIASAIRKFTAWKGGRRDEDRSLKDKSLVQTKRLRGPQAVEKEGKGDLAEDKPKAHGGAGGVWKPSKQGEQ